MQKQYFARIQRAGLGIILFGLLALLLEGLKILPSLEQYSLDLRYAHFNREKKASPRVSVIDIDEQSLKLLSSHYGRWPWPRKIYKELLEFLAIGEPRGVFFDLLFTEPSLIPEDDRVLSEASAQTQLPSHAMLLLQESSIESSTTPELPSEIVKKHTIRWEGSPPPPNFSQTVYRDFNAPAEPYLKTSPKIHVVTVQHEKDGIYRRIPLVFHYGKDWLPSLTLNAILSLFPKKPSLTFSDSILHIDQFNIPIEKEGQYRIHFYRPDHAPEVISFASVLYSAAQLQKGEIQDPSLLKVNPLDFKDKIILIGGSAAGLEDLKITPVSPALPGVLLHATSISNILENDFLKSLNPLVNWIIALLSLLLVYVFTLFIEKNVLRLLAPLILLFGIATLGIYLFRFHSIWLELAKPIGLGILAWIDSLAYLFFIESRDKKKMKESLCKYVPPALAEQIIQSGEDPRAEVGRLEELSILFSDIRGFTTFSEKLEPRLLVQILNEYLSKMTDVVFEHQGTLDKFIGDAVMAFWGAPIHDPEHAPRAIRCALKMTKTLEDLNRTWEQRGLQTLQIGIGINTGKAIIGNIGSEKRLDYTVIGDNVNLASRLEGLTKQYHTGILIAEKTQELSKKTIISRPVDFVRVKGKAQCVKIYEVLAEMESLEASNHLELSERFEEALQAYQEAKFKLALEKFEKLFQETSSLNKADLLSEIYIERCKNLLNEPPQEWDGIYVAKSK